MQQPPSVNSSAQNSASDDAFTGAYVNAEDLLRLRFSATLHRRHQRSASASNNGSRLSKLRGRGVDFDEVRAYQAGDDIRNIDWHVTARKNAPHTKVFREERERPTLVIVDQTHTMFFGSQRRLKSVAAAQAGAIAAWNALAENDRVGGFVMNLAAGELHPPRHSATAVARLVNAVAKHNAQLNRHCPRLSVAELAAQLRAVRRTVRSNYRIYIISDFLPMADFWCDNLTTLAQHNEVSALRVYDPLERELPQDDFYTVTDGTTKTRFDSSNLALRKHYQNRFDDWDEQLRSQLTRAGVRYNTLATSNPDPYSLEWL